MSSSINPNNINGTYPVAGQDNDSQGFRDNFTNIKNNLTFTKNEMEDLQSKVVLKSALLGDATPDNNMSGALLTGPQLKNSTEAVNQLVAISGGLLLDYSVGLLHYTTIDATSGNVTITFLHWPAQSVGYGRIRLYVNVTSNSYTLTMPTAVSVGLADIEGSSGQIITFPSPGKYLFEFSSYDGGATIVMQDLLRNYETQIGNAVTLMSANIIGNTSSTSYNTGALIVTGGVGISGNLYAGNQTPLALANPLGVFTSNVNNYSQLQIQNKSPDVSGSSDLIATTNLGTDSANYIDLGINNSGYTSGSWTMSAANDGYLYINGGNLTIGTDTAAKVVSIHTGGILAASVVAKFYAANTASTTSTTGAMILNGGAGISGALNIGTTISAGGIVTSTGQLRANAAIASTSAATGALIVTGGVGITGTLSTGGARIDAGYQYSAAVTGFNDTTSNSVSRVIYDPAGTLANGTLTLPTANVDALTVTVSSTQTITAFAVLPNLGTTIVPTGNITLSAGTSATYFYHAVETKWYKIG